MIDLLCATNLTPNLTAASLQDQILAQALVNWTLVIIAVFKYGWCYGTLIKPYFNDTDIRIQQIG